MAPLLLRRASKSDTPDTGACLHSLQRCNSSVESVSLPRQVCHDSLYVQRSLLTPSLR